MADSRKDEKAKNILREMAAKSKPKERRSKSKGPITRKTKAERGKDHDAELGKVQKGYWDFAGGKMSNRDAAHSFSKAKAAKYGSDPADVEIHKRGSLNKTDKLFPRKRGK